MKQTHDNVEFHRSRTFISVLLAHLLLLTQFTPLFAQTVKVKRTPAAQTPSPTSTQPIKGGGSKLVTSPTAPAVAGVTATKTDNRTAAQKAGPGDTINYTVVITNNASGDATGVAFTDTVDNNTTLVAGVGTLAADDDYNTIGNVNINVPAAGLLANDLDLSTGNNTGMTASGGTTSVQGGTVSISSNGSFTYDPPVGFTGTDTFTYTATTSTGKTANATVHINVAGRIWFVNNNGGACSSNCDGRLSHPFTSLANFQAINDNGAAATHAKVGDSIFIYQSGASYAGPVTLLNNQKLIGQDSTASLITITGLTQPSGTDPLPAMDTGGNSTVIGNAAANGINLGQGNTIRGLTVTNTGTGTKIAGSNFGTLTLANSASPDVTLSGTGKALDLTTGVLAVPAGFVSVATTSSGGQGISLAGVSDSDGAGGSAFSFGSTSVSGATTQGMLIGTTTADINFGNTTVSAGTDALSFQNNSSGTRTFGTLTATGGGSGSAFLHGTGGGNVTVTGAATLSSPGSAVSVSAPGGTNAINFQAATSATSTGSGNAGVNWAGVSGASLSFSALTIQTNAGTGLNATGGGTVTVTNNTGTINNTTQAASAVVANGITLNANFSTVNSSGGTNGISLTNVAGTSNFGSGTLSGASGAEFLVSGSNPTVTYSGAITQNNAARVVDIQGTTGNTVTLSGTVTGGSSSTGVHIGDTTAVNGNVSFTTLNLGTSGARMTSQAVTISGGTGTYTLGTVSIFTNNASGIVATNADGTLNSTAGTVDSSNATAININGPGGLTTLGMTLTSVTSAGGTADGISIQNTGGSFTVNGDGSNTSLGGNGSGGTISNKSGADNNNTQGVGVFLNNASNITLRRMTINGTNQNFGIHGTSVNTFTLEFSTVSGTNGTTQGLAQPESSIAFDTLTGTASIKSCSIDGGFEDNLRVTNTSGTLNRITVDGCTFGFNNSTGGNNSIQLESQNSGTVLNATIINSTIKGARTDWINASSNSSSTMDLVIGTGGANTFDNTGANAHPAALSAGNRITVSSTATLTYKIQNNTLKGSKGSAIFVRSTGVTGIGGAEGSMNGRITNNIIGVAATANSGSSEASGIDVEADGGGDHISLIDSNQVFQYNNHGILLQFGDNTAGTAGSSARTMVIQMTVTNNTVSNPGNINTNFNGIHLNNGTTSEGAGTADDDQFTSCIDIHGNHVIGGGQGTISPNNQDLRLRQRILTTVKLPGYGGANNDNTAVQNFEAGQNNVGGTPTVAAANNVSGGGGGFIGGSACTQPTVVARGGDFGYSAPPQPEAPQQVAVQRNDITSQPLVVMPQKAQAVKLAEPSAVVKGSSKAETQAAQPAKSAPQVTFSPQTGTVTANIGTMHAGDSVTINFFVTVNNPVSPLTATQVSNQGTVTGTVNASAFSIQTDDPDTGTAGDPTITNLIPAPTINIKNASVPEPPSGSTTMAFTVTLSNAYTVPVSVNFQTNDGTALAGQDYTTTSGTLTYPAGVTVQTVSVPVLHNNAFTTDRTFTVTLSSPSNGILGTSTGTGTITAANPPGTFIISELRTSGPGAGGTGDVTDEFVELYNNTDSPVTVSTSDASAGWALAKTGATCGDDPVVIATIPNGTVIPARGHYLIVGTGYSLANYGGTAAAAGNQTETAEIENNRNVAVFNTATVTNFSTTTRLDAVGFGTATGGNCDLLREGTNLPAANDSILQYSFVRKLATGTPQDTNDNSADFVVVSTTGAAVGDNATPTLGAPGPENSASPIQRNATIKTSLIEPQVPSTAVPNRVRDSTANVCNGGVGPSNCTFGTLDIRRRFKNTTGATVTRLRFRAVDMTAGPNGGPGEADMRLLTGSDFAISTSLGSLTVKGTVLEQPPAQTGGGGLNSTVTVTLPGGGLTNGNTIDVHFLLGVQQGGTYRFFINVEALP